MWYIRVFRLSAVLCRPDTLELSHAFCLKHNSRSLKIIWFLYFKALRCRVVDWTTWHRVTNTNPNLFNHSSPGTVRWTLQAACRPLFRSQREVMCYVRPLMWMWLSLTPGVLITAKVQYVPISFFPPGIPIQAAPPPPPGKNDFCLPSSSFGLTNNSGSSWIRPIGSFLSCTCSVNKINLWIF